MKKLVSLLTVAALLFGGVVFAQNDTKKEEKEGYVFTNLKEIPVTSVKDQARADTC